MSLNWSWMNYAVQVCGWALGLPLQILIVAALLRGGFRRYPFVFLYTVASFLATIVDIIYFAYYRTGGAQVKVEAARAYWIAEWISQFLVFIVVINLIYRATRASRSRRIVRAGLIVGTVLFAGASFLAHYSPALKFGLWMTPWTRDLNFGSAILDLALWTMLLTSRVKDRQLLLLSGALGIQLTGGAISESIRQLATSHQYGQLAFAGDVLGMLSNLTFQFLWWRAFWGDRAAVRKPA